MTVSILDVLATLPSGGKSAPLRDDELGPYLANHYNRDADKDRNARHALRDDLYRDGGQNHMITMINGLFTDATVRKLRHAFVPFARFNNALKRLVNEMSTVYSEPASRAVAGVEDDVRYQQVLSAVRIDEQMLQVSRLLNLHRALLVGFRVRRIDDGTEDGIREPVLDVITPANVRAVTHPNDDALVVGWLVRCSHKTARASAETAAWTLWTDHESVKLREDMHPIGGTLVEHGLGVCPFVPVSLGPPSSGFWPGQEGEDMVSGHLSIWLQNILLLKESKSATKQSVLQGDGTNLGRGQSADSEVPNELADGQSITTVDMSMDLSMFRDTADHVLSHLAQNYGMSPALISHQGVQSAEARELMRMPLKEIRRQQQVPLRRFEHQLALVMAAVLEVDLPALAFSPAGWRMDFAEAETPLDPVAEHDLFEKRRTAGVDNTVAFLMRKHPGLTEEDALEMIENNIAVETTRNVLMRPLQQISGSMGAAQPAVESGDDESPEPAE